MKNVTIDVLGLNLIGEELERLSSLRMVIDVLDLSLIGEIFVFTNVTVNNFALNII